MKFFWRIIPVIAVLGTLAVLFSPGPRTPESPSAPAVVPIKPVPENKMPAKADSNPSVWANGSGGSWTIAGNWSGGHYQKGAIADFSTLNLTDDATVTLDEPVTAGGLIFGDAGLAHNWLVKSGPEGSLTLETGSSAPCITVNNQTATLGVPVIGREGLVKSGSGTLVVTATNSYKGPTTVSQGALQVLGSISAASVVTVAEGATLGGTGSILGSLTVNGILAPGTDAIGTLIAYDRLTLNGTTAMRLDKSGATRLNDSVRGTRSIAYGGTLAVTYAGEIPLAAGDLFTLFSAGSYSGAFSKVTLPKLGAGLEWNSSSLAVNGSISVIRTPPRAVRANDQRSITVKPDPDNSLLINPGKGWVMYGEPSYASSKELVKNVIGVGYSRCDWSVLEPSEGVYDWSRIDDFIDAWAKVGRKIGWRVMNEDSGVGVQYPTPAWVYKSGTNPQTGSVYPVGAASLEISDTTSPTGKQIIPANMQDPVFLARMKEFIAAFGKKYNGNPNIAFLDIGDYGDWGESNASFEGKVTNVTPAQFKNDYLKPYFKAFPNTLLDVNTNMTPVYAPAFAWAVTQGAGARRDGICSHWSADGSEVMVAYPHAPAILEYANTWAGMLADGTDPKSGLPWASPDELMMYVKGGRASYLQFIPQFYEANTEFCQLLGNKMGYHFVLQEAHIPVNIKPGVSFQLRLTWLNDGVAPVYEPCYVAMALLDSDNHEVARQWLPECDPGKWLPDEVKTDEMMVKFTSVPAGINHFAIGLFHDKKDANPAYKLGIKGRTAEGWYILH